MKSLLLAALLASAMPAAAATITGTVTPGSMTVAAYDSTGALAISATAAADGRYTLNVSPGSYRVLAYDPSGVYATSFYPNAESFETSTLLSVQTATASINLSLVRGGFFAGSVKSGATARPGITVAVYNLSGTRRGFTQTDASGQYRLVVPPGQYKLAVYDESQTYASSFYSGQNTFANASIVSVTQSETTVANLAVTLAARIGGTLRDAVTHAMLPGIRATAYDAQGNSIGAAQSDANGHYQLALPAASYRLVFDDAIAGLHASVYWPDAESFDTAAALTVAAGESKTADAAMATGGRFEGTVVSGLTLAPLPNISVAAFNADGTIRARTATDASGHFSLLVPPGTYRAGAFDEALAYAAMFYPQQLVFAGATPVAIVASQHIAISFGLSPGGRIAGIVRDAATSMPVSGAIVGVYAGGTLLASAMTRSDGSYRFVAPHGVFDVIAFDPSLRYATAPKAAVTLAAGQTIEGLNFSMAAGAAVSGDARDLTSRAAIGGITVSAFDANGVEIASTTTRDDGSFAFVVSPGTYRFGAADPAHRYVTSFFEAVATFADARPMTLIAGGSVTISFRLTPAPPPSRRRAVRK
jgi:hypothetical protein